MATQSGTQPPRHHWTPWLLIQASLTDAGLRPLVPGERFWESPGIWVQSSDPLGNPVAGENNYVTARIWNVGSALAAPVQVDFYWANPSLSISEGDCTLIGSEWLQVPTRTHVDVQCSQPWIPIEVNHGHECLIVNCTNYILDPIINPFQPQIERHSAQRNVHVVTAPASGIVPFTLSAENIFGTTASVAVMARMEQVALNPGLANLAQREAINQVAEFGAPTTNTAAAIASRYVEGAAEARLARMVALSMPTDPAPSARLVYSVAEYRGAPKVQAKFAGGGSVIPGSDKTELLRAADRIAAGNTGSIGNQTVIATATLRPFERLNLDLSFSVPPNSQPGEYVAFHLTQTSNGLITGGYTVIVRVI